MVTDKGLELWSSPVQVRFVTTINETQQPLLVPKLYPSTKCKVPVLLKYNKICKFQVHSWSCCHHGNTKQGHDYTHNTYHINTTIKPLTRFVLNVMCITCVTAVSTIILEPLWNNSGYSSATVSKK